MNRKKIHGLIKGMFFFFTILSSIPSSTTVRMDNSAHCDDLLPSILASKQAKDDLTTLYTRLAESKDREPLLSSFIDLDHIRDTTVVYEGTDNTVQHLVYREGHDKAGEEVVFSVAGYIGTFNLPGYSLSPR